MALNIPNWIFRLQLDIAARTTVRSSVGEFAGGLNLTDVQAPKTATWVSTHRIISWQRWSPLDLLSSGGEELDYGNFPWVSNFQRPGTDGQKERSARLALDAEGTVNSRIVKISKR
jgi:hypothetical protein